MNTKLYERVKHVYDEMDKLDLTDEQGMLLEETYKSFKRNGAELSGAEKERLRSINSELSVLTLQFGENVLAETNNYKLVIGNEEDLKGLPANVVETAAETAIEIGDSGKWVFTIHKPSMLPFLQYAENRSLREELYKAYLNCANNGNEFDNNELIVKIVNLRSERAKLLGYPTHAHYILEENMAKTPEAVYTRLNQLWEAALPVAKMEAKQFQEMIDREGNDFELQSWDWWYYAEKVRMQKYNLNEDEIRPYFSLENSKKGLFEVVDRLFGLKFIEKPDLPKPHPDAEAYEVTEADGSHVGILYMDFFPRDSKRGGAWMSSYRKQYMENGNKVTPVITTVFNFTKPTGNTPALLSIEEVTTLYHEIGHALHGLLSQCTYYQLSGTSVSRDFVELPSQIMENWATEPEVLELYAMHYKTGEVIPDELVGKIQAASHFNQGFAMTEYLAASLLDMDYHTLKEPLTTGAQDYEKQSLANIGLIDQIASRYRSTYFRHVFAGGYSAGYYSYTWAEVLDADAFDAFKQGGLFDKDLADRFRSNILERGGTEDPMKLYVRFRGQEPTIQPLLRKKGLL